MAVELCHDSNSPNGFSPRISFSHDLCLSDGMPIEQHPLRSASSGSIDFDFCTRKSFDVESSPADELFSDGKILPTEVKRKPPEPEASPEKRADVKCSSVVLHPSRELEEESDQEKQGSRSFWGFKRSSSLNCGSSYGRTLCPLPLLSRSNSTGSTPSVKKSSPSRHNQKQNRQGGGRSHNQPLMLSAHNNHQKPPLKKNTSIPNYGNTVRVNPVINVPPSNLFCLSSIFFGGGKEKINKKK